MCFAQETGWHFGGLWASTDADEIDALTKRHGGFALRHLLEGTVNAIPGEGEVLTAEACDFAGSEESAFDENP